MIKFSLIQRATKAGMKVFKKGISTQNPFIAVIKNEGMETLLKRFAGKDEFVKTIVTTAIHGKPINNGCFNNIYSIEGFESFLIKAPKKLKASQTGVLQKQGLRILENNPNHVIGKIGNIEILEQVPGINFKSKEFFNVLSQLPQRSFNDFTKLIRDNLQKGFYHDYRGANTLADLGSTIISTIDSFTQKSSFYRSLSDAVTSSCLGLGTEYKKAVKESPELKNIGKKVFKSLYNDLTITHKGLNLGTSTAFLARKDKTKAIKLFKEINAMKLKINTTDIKEIKSNSLWPELKSKLRELNKLVDSN